MLSGPGTGMSVRTRSDGPSSTSAAPFASRGEIASPVSIPEASGSVPFFQHVFVTSLQM